MGVDSGMDSVTGTRSSKTLMIRQNTIIQYLKTQLDKSADGSSIRLPGCSVKRMYERTSCSGNSSLSWSVMKKISSVFRLRTVSCLTQASAVQTNEVLREKSDEMSMEEEIRNFIAAETGMDRLRRARHNRYRESEEPEELQVALRVGIHVGFLCFLGAFIKHGVQEMEEYTIRARTKLFGAKSLYMKRLASTGIAHGMKKGCKFSFIGFSMAFTFALVWRGVGIYFNTSSFWTFGVAAGTVLSTFKANLGCRGMFAGFVIGNVLGNCFGVLFSGILKAMNCTQQQINYEQVRQIVEKRREYRKFSAQEVEVDDEAENFD